MGIGDCLMAAGEARRAAETHGRPVAILDRRGRQKWYGVWDYCPDVLPRNQWRDGLPYIVNGGQRRPYIDYSRSARHRWAWLPYRPVPAKVILPPDLLHWAEQYRGRVVIEPRIKAGASPNKQWGRWADLMTLRPDLPWLEMPALPSFGHALAVLSVASAAVLPEGGLHHAAAAVGLPAVVIFGGYISPDVTGYDTHINLFTGGEACGNRGPCRHCEKAMSQISPAQVVAALDSILRKAA